RQLSAIWRSPPVGEVTDGASSRVAAIRVTPECREPDLRLARCCHGRAGVGSTAWESRFRATQLGRTEHVAHACRDLACARHWPRRVGHVNSGVRAPAVVDASGATLDVARTQCVDYREFAPVSPRAGCWWGLDGHCALSIRSRTIFRCTWSPLSG